MNTNIFKQLHEINVSEDIIIQIASYTNYMIINVTEDNKVIASCLLEPSEIEEFKSIFSTELIEENKSVANNEDEKEAIATDEVYANVNSADLIRLRKISGLKQYEVADEIGCHQGDVSAYELGKRRMNQSLFIKFLVATKNVNSKFSNNELRKILLTYRINNNYTVEQLSDKSGIPIDRINDWENNVERIDSNSMLKLTKILPGLYARLVA